MMKMTKRESILIIILVSLVLSWIYYKFVYIPQSNKLYDLKNSEALYSQRLEEMNDNISLKDELNNTLTDLDSKISVISSKYFSDIKQEEIIYILSKFIQQSNINIPSISFSQFKNEKISDVDISIISAIIPFKGKYNQLANFLESINGYKKKIIINNINISNNEDGDIIGDIQLDFYSIPEEFSSQQNLITWNDNSDNTKENPFEIFPEYQYEITKEVFLENSKVSENNNTENYLITDNGIVGIEFGYSMVELESFEDADVRLISSPSGYRSSTSCVTNAKRGAYSLQVGYDFPQSDEKKTGYILLDNKNITISEAPNSIGIWIYSYKKSADSVNITLRASSGEAIIINLASNIDWTGWKLLEKQLPNDLSIYPLKVDNIFFEVNSSISEQLVLLLDSLSINYDTEITEDLKSVRINQSNHNNTYTSTNVNEEEFIYYEIQKGDTLFSITNKFLGDASYMDLLMQINNIYDKSKIKLGEVLKIPKQ